MAAPKSTPMADTAAAATSAMALEGTRAETSVTTAKAVIAATQYINDQITSRTADLVRGRRG
jgi:hypothetical protein